MPGHPQEPPYLPLLALRVLDHPEQGDGVVELPELQERGDSGELLLSEAQSQADPIQLLPLGTNPTPTSCGGSETPSRLRTLWRARSQPGHPPCFRPAEPKGQEEASEEPLAINLNDVTEVGLDPWQQQLKAGAQKGFGKALERLWKGSHAAPPHLSTRQSHPSSSPSHSHLVEGVGASEGKAQHLLEAFPCPCGGFATSRPPSTAGNGAHPTPTRGSGIVQGLLQPHLPKEEEGEQEREASPHPGLEALCKG